MFILSFRQSDIVVIYDHPCHRGQCTLYFAHCTLYTVHRPWERCDFRCQRRRWSICRRRQRHRRCTSRAEKFFTNFRKNQNDIKGNIRTRGSWLMKVTRPCSLFAITKIKINSRFLKLAGSYRQIQCVDCRGMDASFHGRFYCAGNCVCDAVYT